MPMFIDEKPRNPSNLIGQFVNDKSKLVNHYTSARILQLQGSVSVNPVEADTFNAPLCPHKLAWRSDAVWDELGPLMILGHNVTVGWSEACTCLCSVESQLPKFSLTPARLIWSMR